MRWTWICCVAVVGLGCGPAVEPESEAGGSTGPAASTGSSGVNETVAPTDPSVTEGSSGDGTESSGGVTTGAPTLDGEFFLAIYATPVAPTTPFQFIADVKAGDGQVVMSLTPLSLDIASVDTPREPVPPPFEVSGPIDADGFFAIEVPELLIPGATNPVTGSDIVASATLEGVIEMDRICGRVSGMITVPANIDLTGSSLAGVRLDGGPLPLPDDLDCAP